ncbi:MAG: tryptophan--tRNA ligase [Oscillospiraceae bacterium]|nr:tryptophan--tRNA ligase [Oscillospiraceae bacterium]
MNKNIFSAIQPSAGSPTIGNYFGAIKNWVSLQDKYSCIFAIADLHAISVRQDPKVLHGNILSVFATLLACGIDPKKSLFFLQSQVHEHSELAWILGCFTQFGELSRMTQFKSKSEKISSSSVNVGLFTYPSLMAADILLYNTNLVPVGADQKQHLEITRTIAMRFNGLYGDTFVVPEPLIPETGAKIMSLQDPSKKMSKSDENESSRISIFDDESTIIRKFSRAVTDSDNKVLKSPDKKGVNNLMTIYSCATGKNDEEIQKEFSNRGYKDFKEAVANVVYEQLKPIQKNFSKYMENENYIKSCYEEGASRASDIAKKTLRSVKEKVGFLV